MAERAYGVIGLGARAAKIKQVCSVITRGGEREREGERGRESRESEGRETEGGRGPTAELLSGPKQLVEKFPRARCALQKQLETEEGGRGNKKKKRRRRSGERKKERERK